MNNNLKVLYLEDSQQDIELLREMLIADGFELDMDTTESKKEFETFLKLNKYDVILAGFKLPGFDGFRALRWVMEICPDIPFIIISGVIGEEKAIELVRLGAADFILKDRMARLPKALQDAIERKQAEQELRKLSTAVTQSPASLIITDAEGIIEYVNPKFVEVTGYGLNEVIGQKPSILKSGEQPDSYYQTLWTTISSGKTWRGEFHNKKKNGELYWESANISPILDDSGIITQYIAVKEDITERKEAELLLRETEEQLVMAEKIGHTGSWTYYIETDNFWASTEAHRIYGLSLDNDRIPIELIEACIPERKRVHQSLVDLINGVKDYHIEFSINPADGSAPKIINSIAILERDKQRNPLKIHGFIQDITERKHTEEALLESNSLRELLLDIVTHDLKNPAGVIYAMSEMARKDMPENRIMESIFSTSERLIEVINQTTILSQAAFGETIPKEALSLNALIEETVDEFGPDLKVAEMDLVVAIDPYLTIMANPLIGEVFKNYISNAIKYARDGKRVVIETVIEDQTVMICVKDFGKTITEADRTAVFKRQVQLEDGEKRGRGLGLAIVKRIAGAHGGEVWVEPNTPQGNSFCLRIPR